MKKIILLLSLIAFVTTAHAQSTSGTATTGSTTTGRSKTDENAMHTDWQTVKEGYWKSKDGKMYKLENAMIMTSDNGRNWKKAEKAMWQDADGNWIMISDDKLQISKDGGSTWTSAPDGWKAPDGKWYKFDKNWKLTTMKTKKNTENKEKEGKTKSKAN